MNKLNFCESSGSLTIYSFFLGIHPSTGPTLTNRTVLLLAILNAWISTGIQNLTKKYICSAIRQNQYGDDFGKFLQLVRNHNTDTVRVGVPTQRHLSFVTSVVLIFLLYLKIAFLSWALVHEDIDPLISWQYSMRALLSGSIRGCHYSSINQYLGHHALSMD